MQLFLNIALSFKMTLSENSPPIGTPTKFRNVFPTIFNETQSGM